ncbi:hypothetical protein ASF63_15560 [Microbacterium sp. Leaf320]|nr:hypothetical protein ASF63_15560 [Microbacterium sp. Leaf320]
MGVAGGFALAGVLAMAQLTTPTPAFAVTAKDDGLLITLNSLDAEEALEAELSAHGLDATVTFTGVEAESVLYVTDPVSGVEGPASGSWTGVGGAAADAESASCSPGDLGITTWYEGTSAVIHIPAGLLDEGTPVQVTASGDVTASAVEFTWQTTEGSCAVVAGYGQ